MGNDRFLKKKSYSASLTKAHTEIMPGAKHHSKVHMYCVKCKSKVWCTDYRKESDARGRPRLAGRCPDCQTKVFKYVPMDK